MTTPAQLPGLTSEHEFFSPIDENFERDMEAAFRRSTRGEDMTPTMWPHQSAHVLEFDQARNGVPMLPMDQALNNPNGPWGGVKGAVQWHAYGRGLRGLGQAGLRPCGCPMRAPMGPCCRQALNGLGAEVTPVPWYEFDALGQVDPETGGKTMLMVGGGLLAAWVIWMMVKDRKSAFAGGR
jgi:hypothetical protein